MSISWSFSKDIDASSEQLLRVLTCPADMLMVWVKELSVVAADGHLRTGSDAIKTGDRMSWTDWSGRKSEGHVLDVRNPAKIKFTYGLCEGVPVNIAISLDAIAAQKTRVCVQEESSRNTSEGRQLSETNESHWKAWLNFVKETVETGDRNHGNSRSLQETRWN